jgi:2-phosphoglycolate phosphatase
MKAVGFDLDGTLIDSTDAIVASFMHAFDALRRPSPPRDTIVSTISLPLEHQFRLLGVTNVTEAAAVYREHYVREAPATTRVLPGVREALERLHAAGIPMGVATSKKRSSAEVLLPHLGIAHYFACCIGPEDVARPKPDPEPILALAGRMGVAPADLLYVGDTALDVAAARAAGAACWAVTTGYHSREELEGAAADRIFDSIADVAKSVLKGGRWVT